MKVRGLTPYQLEILEAVRKAAAEGYDIDLDQLLDTLSWKPTKQSLQFSIRALIAKKMILKAGMQIRRGRKRVCFCLTREAEAVFDPRSAAAPEEGVPGISEDLPAGLEDLDPGVSDDG